MGEGVVRSFTTPRLLAVLVPAALLTGALGSQYIGGLAPCEMCHWQRWPHYAALALGLLAVAASRSDRDLSRRIVILAACAIMLSGAIGVYHAGVELGVFKGLTSCSSFASGATAQDLLASIMAAPIVRCDAVQFAFAGISMAGWNAILSLASGGLILWLITRR